ncbi:endolytic transglycosylase MltG [Nocardioides sp. CER19]|uniref:endolytic transglycosylase MltG n=1 Tax=Nocardioides sp. CER19 TaxID=3038538 RepID=UPI00244C3572|nr:endolytic transglycosylase MltG [Nocardioides sp. CER19]MDH2416430.1 endolytic transglycosylase MltG [Nocardioides sp. CER19]
MSEHDERGHIPGFGDTAERPVVGEEDLAHDEYVDEAEPPRHSGHRAERRRSRVPGCLAGLVALAVVVALVWGGFSFVKGKIDGLGGGGGGDYSGQAAHGQVTVEVKPGDTAAQIGRSLKSAGVVKSVDAFISAANANSDAAGIQVGYYSLQQEMSAENALAVLVDPKNIVKTSVTIPEGLRVVDIVDVLAKKTGFKKAQFEKALKDPSIGLPAYAKGNPEGYLFPATYAFGPKDQPVDMITKMVARWQQAAKDNDLEAKAAELGYTPAEMMTIASLVQAEGRGDDMPKIARVIYNRLEGPGDKQGTNGRLQIDATVNYALGRKGVATVTTAETQTDSPYNTYVNAGLPPGPIEAPGDDAIQAATHPAEGDWYYYATVNLKTGETKFAKTYDEFLKLRQELKDYCDNESAGAC